MSKITTLIGVFTNKLEMTSRTNVYIFELIIAMVMTYHVS